MTANQEMQPPSHEQWEENEGPSEPLIAAILLQGQTLKGVCENGL